MALEDRLRIATSEGIDVDLVITGLGSRFLAAMLDTLLQFVLLIAPLVVLGATGFGGTWSDAVAAVWTLLALLGYYPIFETIGTGRTIGKRAAGIRVVDRHGQPIRFLTSMVRNLIRIVDFLPLFYGVGITAILVTSRSQRLGDLAAGTYVVRERLRSPAPTPASSLAAPSPSPPPADSHTVDVAVAPWMEWDVSGISAAETALARRFLDRRWTLAPYARHHFAAQLSARLRPKVPGIPDWPDETVVECIVAAKSARG